MRGKGEGCYVEIYQTDSHFIKIPEKWIDSVTVRKNNVSLDNKFQNAIMGSIRLK